MQAMPKPVQSLKERLLSNTSHKDYNDEDVEELARTLENPETRKGAWAVFRCACAAEDESPCYMLNFWNGLMDRVQDACQEHGVTPKAMQEWAKEEFE